MTRVRTYLTPICLTDIQYEHSVTVFQEDSHNAESESHTETETAAGLSELTAEEPAELFPFTHFIFKLQT